MEAVRRHLILVLLPALIVALVYISKIDWL